MENAKRAEELINEIYAKWKVIYNDENGEHRLPTSKKAVTKSKEILEELKKMNIEDNYLKNQIKEIEEILHRATKRKFNFSIQIFIALVLFLGMIIIQRDLLKKPGYRVLELTEQELIERKNKSLEVTKKNLESSLKIKNAGYENYLKDRDDLSEKKKKERWDRRMKKIPEKEKYIKEVTPLNAEEYRQYYIKDAIKSRNQYLRTVIAYIIFYILYLFVSRRPNFLYWRKGADKDVFSKLENSVGGGIASAAFTSLYTVPSATIQKITWSNGMVTKGVSSFGANIFVFVMIMLLLFFFYLLVAVTIPFRVIINYLRNFVLYI